MISIGVNLHTFRAWGLASNVIRPLLDSAPTVTTTAIEGDDAVVSTDDTWLLDGVSTAMDEREYRLRVNGSVVDGPQASEVLSIPLASAGDDFTVDLRARVTGGDWSAWTQVGAPTTILATNMPEIKSVTVIPDGIVVVHTGTLQATVSVDSFSINVTGVAMGDQTAIFDGLGGLTVGFTLEGVPQADLVIPAIAIMLAENGIEPTAPSYLHGNTLEDSVASWFTVIEGNNFTSTGGDVSVALTYIGVGDSEDTFIAGETVGYRLTMTDTAGSDPLIYEFQSAVAATAPGALSTLAATKGDTEVTLNFNAPSSDGGSPITDYTIERRTGAGGAWTVIADGVDTNTSYVDTGLTNETLYQYRVSATNAIGTGEPSFTASATPSVSSDNVAPTFIVNGWDNAEKEFDWELDEPATVYIGTHLSTETLAINAGGGFTGNSLEVFTYEALEGQNTFAPLITDETAERVSYYAVDASGNPTVIYTVTIDFVVGDFTYDASVLSDRVLDTQAEFEAFRGTGLSIASGEIVNDVGDTSGVAFVGIMTADHFGELELSDVGGNRWIWLRCVDSDNCVAVQIRSAGNVRIYDRIAGADGSNIGSNVTFAVPPVSGDLIRASISGSVVTVTKNGAEADTRTVSTANDAGRKVAFGVSGGNGVCTALTIGDV